MRQQLASLSELLNIERRASADLAADLVQLQTQLETSETRQKAPLPRSYQRSRQHLVSRNSELTAA